MGRGVDEDELFGGMPVLQIGDRPDVGHLRSGREQQGLNERALVESRKQSVVEVELQAVEPVPSR